jgi:hypothetical protein
MDQKESPMTMGKSNFFSNKQALDNQKNKKLAHIMNNMGDFQWIFSIESIKKS